MEKTDAVWVEPQLENLLKSSEVVVEGFIYTVYFESEIRASDVAFGFSKEGDNNISLFQITVDSSDKNSSREQLGEVDFKKKETLKELVEVGEKLKKSYNPEELKSIKIQWRNYILSYQADDIKILDQSLHDQYYKKLKKRIY